MVNKLENHWICCNFMLIYFQINLKMASARSHFKGITWERAKSGHLQPIELKLTPKLKREKIVLKVFNVPKCSRTDWFSSIQWKSNSIYFFLHIHWLISFTFTLPFSNRNHSDTVEDNYRNQKEFQRKLSILNSQF